MKTQNVYMPQDVLIPYFGTEKNIVGVEIGVAAGDGSLTMLYFMPNLKIYCIDPWEHRDKEGYEASFSQEQHDRTFEIAKTRLGTYGDKAILIKKRSDDAVFDIPEIVDFVYIDGHHEYTQVLRDIENYYHKVRSGGIIGGHDYGQVPDVTWAVNQFFPIEEINKGDDFTWWVFKK